MNLRELAVAGVRIADDLGRPGPVRQILALAEKAGDVAGAFRAANGLHQYTGAAERVEVELAALVIIAFVAAAELGIDLDNAIEHELRTVFERTDWQRETS